MGAGRKSCEGDDRPVVSSNCGAAGRASGLSVIMSCYGRLKERQQERGRIGREVNGAGEGQWVAGRMIRRMKWTSWG